MPLPLLVFLLALYPILGYMMLNAWAGAIFVIATHRHPDPKHSLLNFWLIRTHIAVLLWPIFAAAILALYLTIMLLKLKLSEGEIDG